MNILVTGGAGFIGSNLIHHLLDQPGINHLVNLDALTYAGHLDNLAEVANHPRYTLEQVDLRDLHSVKRVVAQHGITHVMHLAAESHVDRSIEAPSDFVTTNVVGTFHLLEACRSAWLASPAVIRDPDSRARFHHVSTDEVYGSLGPEGRFTERSPYSPNSPYAATKASADMLVRAYHRTYGLPVVLSNCSNNFGPYQFPEKLIPVVIQCCLERQPIPVYGDGQQVRDWLFVKDHAAALWMVLTQGTVGDTYNIGGQHEQSNLRTIEQICECVDALRPDLGGQSRALIRNVRDRPGHDRRYAIDASKIQRELGWKPAHDFDTALEETVRWYVENQDWVRSVRGKTPSPDR